jgi:hypothetical protein
MSDETALPLQFTEAAASKVKVLIADEENPNLKLRGLHYRWRLQRIPIRLHF